MGMGACKLPANGLGSLALQATRWARCRLQPYPWVEGKGGGVAHVICSLHPSVSRLFSRSVVQSFSELVGQARKAQRMGRQPVAPWAAAVRRMFRRLSIHESVCVALQAATAAVSESKSVLNARFPQQKVGGLEGSGSHYAHQAPYPMEDEPSSPRCAWFSFRRFCRVPCIMQRASTRCRPSALDPNPKP
jgi:hypothetical protein